MNSSLLVLLIVSYFLTPHRAFGQTAEMRNVDKEAGSQSRSIYGARHLSPHRKMHFGKRPMMVPPPMIMEVRAPQIYKLSSPSVLPIGRNFDLDLEGRLQEQPQRRFVRELGQSARERLPILFTIDVGGRVLQAVAEEASDQSRSSNMEGFAPVRHSSDGEEFTLMDNSDLQQIVANFHRDLDRGELQISDHRQMPSMKLVDEAGPGAGGQLQSEVAANGNELFSTSNNNQASATNEQAQSTSNSFDESANIQQPSININTRSMGQLPARAANTLALPSSFFSSLGGSPVGGRVSFNKKAEPKSNWFMHFG